MNARCAAIGAVNLVLPERLAPARAVDWGDTDPGVWLTVRDWQCAKKGIPMGWTWFGWTPGRVTWLQSEAVILEPWDLMHSKKNSFFCFINLN